MTESRKIVRKGVVLAGGKGTRLQPATLTQNKHMLSVLNVPMILYPIHTLKQLGVEEILLVSGGNHIGAFAEFLRSGEDYGVDITYKVQDEAAGIAAGLSLAEDFMRGEDLFAVVLGDNYFENISTTHLKHHPTLFLKEVDDPSRFGVYNKRDHQIAEKPKMEGPGMAVTGLYIYGPEVFEMIRLLVPSARGEYEITDVNNRYLNDGDVDLVDLGETAWTDMGTPESLRRAINYIASKPNFDSFVV